jgi:hypothetical protein
LQTCKKYRNFFWTLEENFVPYYIRYGAFTLRKKVNTFIKLHPKKVVQTSGWQTILKEHPHLVTDIVASFDKS